MTCAVRSRAHASASFFLLRQRRLARTATLLHDRRRLRVEVTTFEREFCVVLADLVDHGTDLAVLDLARGRERVEAERVAVVAHRLEVHRLHLRAAGFGHVTALAVERAPALRRVESVGFEVLLMVEPEAGVFLEPRGDRHALRRELAVRVPVRQVELELRVRGAEVLTSSKLLAFFVLLLRFAWQSAHRRWSRRTRPRRPWWSWWQVRHSALPSAGMLNFTGSACAAVFA